MNIDRPFWIVHLEVLAFPDHTCEEGKVGFLDAVVEADDCFAAEERVALTLRDHNCEILEIAKTVPLDVSHMSHASRIPELIHQLKASPNRILLSELSCHEQEQELAA